MDLLLFGFFWILSVSEKEVLVGGVMFFPGANYLLGNLDLELRLGAELGNRINLKITSLITAVHCCHTWAPSWILS